MTADKAIRTARRIRQTVKQVVEADGHTFDRKHLIPAINTVMECLRKRSGRRYDHGIEVGRELMSGS